MHQSVSSVTLETLVGDFVVDYVTFILTILWSLGKFLLTTGFYIGTVALLIVFFGTLWSNHRRRRFAKLRQQEMLSK